MADKRYSVDLCSELIGRAQRAGLAIPWHPSRYEDGDVLEISFTTVWPEVQGRGHFRIRKFVGGGFAGQVYRCVLEQLEIPASAAGPIGLRVGGVYAVKMMIPPSRGATAFRNALYWLAFQAPFSAQVNEAACRVGLLWPKMARLAMRVETGQTDAVADVYASFFDERLGTFGEIREWVEGRTWLLEPDTHLWRRRKWRTVAPEDSGSREYIAKRRFMDGFVRLLHRMGARELARQYEWWTMKSQPNVLKRSGAGRSDPAAGLCAVDFRAGLALLPFLPMSPRDVGLILEGLCRGALVQFDRCDYARLRAYAAAVASRCPDLAAMAEAAARYDEAYRRAMPDVTRQGWRLLTSSRLRRDVRRGLCEAYRRTGAIDDAFAARLADRPLRFAGFQSLMVLPFAGRRLRRLWGHAGYRRHVRLLWTDAGYRSRAFRAGVARRLVDWHRAGRTGEARTRLLANAPFSFWLQRLTLGWLPAGLHRVIAEPSFVARRLKAGWRFMRSFYVEAAFRERWLTELVEQGHAEGMLEGAERDLILQQIRETFIIKYLKSLAVHFATLPVTQIVSVTVGTIVAVKVLLAGGGWDTAGLRFLGILLLFQAIPISPGSLCRGFYVMYLIARDRDFRDYMVAAPLSFVKYIGYLAFPIQMVATYPALARFMASHWATGAVHVVPVFGEKGALFEHAVFDLFFNVPRAFGAWARRRVRRLLDLWLVAGIGILAAVHGWARVSWTSKAGVNLLIGVTVVCLLPRLLFYPMLSRRRRRK